VRCNQFLIALFTIVICPLASAQHLRFDVDDPDMGASDLALAVFDEPIYFSVAGGFAEQFSSDLATGDYSVSRFNFAVSAQTQLNDAWNIGFTFRTLLDSYDFSPTASLGMGSAPWEDILTLSFGARAQVKLNDKWSLAGGPVLQFSRETGADWGDSVTVGGTVSAIYQWTDELAIGVGVGVISQLEDDALIVPIITVEWKFSDTLRITSSAPTATSLGGELVWEFAPTWELAFGAGYANKRFRLDNTGIAPGGVGEETYFPVSLRLGWNPSDQFSVSIFGGFAFANELTLETATGARIAQETPDGAVFAGFAARIQF